MDSFSLLSRQFRGWRRKLGLAASLISIIFAIASIESRYRQIENYFPLTEKLQFVLWAHQGSCAIAIVTVEESPSEDHRGWTSGSSDIDIYHAGFRFLRLQQNSAELGLGFLGIAVPFWFIVIPSALLSAYLLLSKPSATTLKKADKPTAEGDLPNA